MTPNRSSRHWFQLQVSVVSRPGGTISLIPATPVGRLGSAAAFLLCAGAGCALGLHRGAVWLPALGTLAGAAIVLVLRHAWRLRKPVLVIDVPGQFVTLPRLSRKIPWEAITEVRGLAGFESRGYREYSINLLVTENGEQRQLHLLDRNNFDNDPFGMHDDSTPRELAELCREIAGAIGTRAEILEERQELREGSPVRTPPTTSQEATGK